ncbi:MAG: hypothetical protein JNL58_15920 [Planctomyces sp.]|nr:hypothetical protein [Planctomyces sp.]
MSTSTTSGRSGTAERGASSRKLPKLTINRYDIATAGLMAMLSMAAAALAILIAIWLANRLTTDVVKEPFMESGGGGYEDGTPDATPDVDSPEDPTDDPSVANDQQEVTELMEITDPVVEVAENAAQLVEPTEFSDQKNTGNPGSAEGTGGRPFGSGGGTGGGVRRENRWFVQFSNTGDLKTYASQLDFFKIEIGALFATENRLVYLSNMAADRPTTREVTTGDSEKRLFMNWEGGNRKEADVELFQKAGIDAKNAAILHFYPSAVEQQLAQLESEYSGGRPPEQIRRTFFEVRPSGGGFQFVVTSQKLK